MVYLTPEIKRVCEEASVNDLKAVRQAYRHTLRGVDLKWLDTLINDPRRSEGHLSETPVPEVA